MRRQRALSSTRRPFSRQGTSGSSQRQRATDKTAEHFGASAGFSARQTRRGKSGSESTSVPHGDFQYGSRAPHGKIGSDGETRNNATGGRQFHDHRRFWLVSAEYAVIKDCGSPSIRYRSSGQSVEDLQSCSAICDKSRYGDDRMARRAAHSAEKYGASSRLTSS